MKNKIMFQYFLIPESLWFIVDKTNNNISDLII